MGAHDTRSRERVVRIQTGRTRAQSVESREAIADNLRQFLKLLV